MEMLGKAILGFILLLILINLLENKAENYSQYGSMEELQETMPMQEMMQLQETMPMPMQPTPSCETPQGSVPNLRPCDSVETASPPTEEVVGMVGAFGASAPVPKCEDEFCTGCLFCQTPRSGSCGYSTDDTRSGRDYMDLIKKIRTDKGEDWNMNYVLNGQQ